MDVKRGSRFPLVEKLTCDACLIAEHVVLVLCFHSCFLFHEHHNDAGVSFLPFYAVIMVIWIHII